MVLEGVVKAEGGEKRPVASLCPEYFMNVSMLTCQVRCVFWYNSGMTPMELLTTFWLDLKSALQEEISGPVL